MAEEFAILIEAFKYGLEIALQNLGGSLERRAGGGGTKC